MVLPPSTLAQINSTHTCSCNSFIPGKDFLSFTGWIPLGTSQRMWLWSLSPSHFFFFFFHFKKRLCAEWFTHLILKSWQSTAQQVSSFQSSHLAPARNPIRHVRSGVGHHPQRTPLSHIMTCSHIAQVRTSASPVFSCVTSGEFPKCSASVSLHVKWG